MKDIIIAPVITEKSQIAISSNNVYTFKVSKEDIEKDNREKYNDFNDERYIKFLNFCQISLPKPLDTF